jgi:opacity protein-like surface antigen
MKKLFLIICLFTIINQAFPQKELSVIAGIGTNKMSGDIGGDNFNKLFQNNLGTATSFGIRYTLPAHWGFRLFTDYSNYKGKDETSYNGVRTLSFKSSAWSIGGQVEYIIFGSSFVEKELRHSLYILSGANPVFANTTLFDKTGDEIHQNENSFALFLGAGYQYRFSNKLSIGFEAKQNKFFSDKMDGYYPNVPDNKNDDYAMDFKLTVSYYFTKGFSTGGLWEREE